MPADAIGQEFSPNAQNVRFRFGEVRGCPGRGLYDASPNLAERTRLLTWFSKADGTLWPMMFMDTKVYRRGDTTPQVPAIWKEVQAAFVPPGGGWWDATAGEGQLFFTNGLTDILRWDGVPANQYVKITSDAGFEGVGGTANCPRPRYMEYIGGRLMCAYTVEGGTVYANRIRWPQLGDYRKWDETKQLGAGFVDIYDDYAEPIANFVALGSAGVVYRPHSIAVLTPTGTLTPTFQLEVRVRGIGLLASRTVANTGQAHFFLGHDGNVWSWDGVRVQAIGDPILEELRSVIDRASLDNYFGFAAADRQEYWLVLGEASVFVYDYARGSWTRDTFPNLTAGMEIDILVPTVTWADLVGQWNQQGQTWEQLGGSHRSTVIGGRADGATMDVNETFAYDYFAEGSIIDRVCETEDMYLPEPWKLGQVTRLLLLYTYINDNPFEIGISFDRGRNWTTQQLTPVASGYSWVDFISTGNVVRFRFRENNAEGQFRWRSYAYEFVPGGEFIGTDTFVGGSGT